MMRLLTILAVLVFLSQPTVAQSSSPERLAELAATATAAQQRGDYPAAVSAYRSLDALSPGNPQIESNLGIALYLDKQWSEALAVLRRASEKDAHLFPPHLFAGLALFHLADYAHAAAELEAARRLNPADPTALLWLGYTRFAQASYPQAIDVLQQLLVLQPSDIDALYTLGKSYSELSLADTRTLLRDFPDGARFWQLAAVHCRNRNDREDAMRFYGEAAKRRPGDPEISGALARLDPHAAVQTTQTSMPLTPAAAREDALYRKIESSENDARSAFSKIGALAPDSFRTHQLLADSLAAQGRDPDAIAEYSAALRIAGDLPELHSALGALYSRDGQPANARHEFELALAAQPNAATTHVQLARELLSLGDLEAARHQLSLASLLPSPPVTIYKLQGKVAVERKEYARATAALEHYLTERPTDSSAHYLLARCYTTSGNATGARAQFALARKYSPDASSRRAAARALNQPESAASSDIAFAAEDQP